MHAAESEHTVDLAHWESSGGERTGARARTRRYVRTSCSAVLKRGRRLLACRPRRSPSGKRARAPRRIRPSSMVPKNTTGTDCPLTAAHPVQALQGYFGSSLVAVREEPVHAWLL